MNPVEIIALRGGVQADPGCEGFKGENPGSGQMTQWWHFVESGLGTDTVMFQCAMVDTTFEKTFLMSIVHKVLTRLRDHFLLASNISPFNCGICNFRATAIFHSQAICKKSAAL